MDDQRWPTPSNQLDESATIPYVEIVVLEAFRLPQHAVAVPRRIALGAEEIGSHVVVDSDHAPATGVQEGRHL